MPGYGVANPGSLIVFVFLIYCNSTSTWPMRLSKFTPSLCTVQGGVFGGIYFYRNMFNFMPMPNAAFGSSFASGIHRPPFRREKSAAHPHAGRVASRPSCLGRWSFSWRWVGLLFGVRCYCSLCSLGAACCWFACLLGAVLRFCLVPSCYNEAPLLVRVSAGRGQLLCPWDRGDKVVSSCWWVRACFIHPETLFQTLSHTINKCSPFLAGSTI